VPFPSSSKVEAAKACNEKIGHKTIRGPWRFEFDASTPWLGYLPQPRASPSERVRLPLGLHFVVLTR